MLAEIISTLPGVGVGIEARFQDGWIRGPAVRIQNDADLESYLETLYGDEKFNEWNVDRNKLQSKLMQKGFPLEFGQVLRSCLELYFAPEQPDVLVHKCGHYIRCIDRILDEIPDAKFLFIDRDPRAIFNSQRVSRASFYDGMMQNNAVYFALEHVRAQEEVRKHLGSPYFLYLRYEDLLDQEETVREQICSFLQVPNVKRNREVSYREKIPQAQQHLHPLVGSEKMVKDRGVAWKNELPREDRLFLEKVIRIGPEKSLLPDRDTEAVSLRQSLSLLNRAFEFRRAQFLIRLGVLQPPYAG
jgi:hypothetical protein